MLTRLKTWLTSTPAGKTAEHYAVAFLAAFGLTAIASLEHAASIPGFQLDWSLLAGVGMAGLRAGYDLIRPALVALLAKLAS